MKNLNLKKKKIKMRNVYMKNNWIEIRFIWSTKINKLKTEIKKIS